MSIVKDSARALKLLTERGWAFEIRVIRQDGKVHSQIFHSVSEASQAIAQIEAEHQPKGVYVTLNRIGSIPDEGSTKDEHIAKRRWLPIDIDPKTKNAQSGISSTAYEKKKAKTVANKIRSHLSKLGWPEPIYADSGNGYRLWYRIDLPNDQAAKQLLRNCLQALDTQFTNGNAKVDTSMWNASRIDKVAGTWARKGPTTKSRPHRKSKLLKVPSTRKVVSLKKLKGLANKAPKSASPVFNSNGKANGKRLDVDKWLTDSGIAYTKEVKASGDVYYHLEICPTDPSHDNPGGKDCSVIQRANGQMAYSCFHDRCDGKGWQDVKKALGPPESQHYIGSATVVTVSVDTVDVRTKDDSWEPLPLEVFPAPLRAFIEHGSTTLNVDPSYLALPILACCSSSIGNSRRIRLNSDWSEPAILWTVLVANSGTLKSPAYDLALAPTQEREDQLYNEYLNAYAEWEIRQKTNKDAKKPKEKRVVVVDTSIERLAGILEANQRGVLLHRDELAGWFKSFRRYRPDSSDLPNWLSIHRGERITIDRQTDLRHIHIANSFVAITGTVQPGTLRRLLNVELYEAGLVQRLTLAMPPERKKKWQKKGIPKHVKQDYYKVINKLHDLTFITTPQPIPLSRGAEKKWAQFYTQHADGTFKADDTLKSLYGKLEGIAARFALIFHLVEETTKPKPTKPKKLAPISAKAMQAGIKLARWFLHENRRIYQYLHVTSSNGNGNGTVSDSQHLLELLARNEGEMRVRDIQNCSSRFSKVQDVKTVVEELEKNGKVTTHKGKRKDQIMVRLVAEL